MRLNDVKNFCEVRKINATFVRVGVQFLASIPKNRSPEVVKFLEVNAVSFTAPVEILNGIHDIYLSLSG